VSMFANIEMWLSFLPRSDGYNCNLIREC
jgi:hypothetical protein